MQTSFHIGGFWFYVQWSHKGEIGRDQHGNYWFNHRAPYSADHAVEHICQSTHQTLVNQAKQSYGTNNYAGKNH
jgi:hypothetical protein